MRNCLVRGLFAACFVLLFTAAGQAAELLTLGDQIIAIDLDPPASTSNYPMNESPFFAVDGDAGTKYLNFSKENSGFIATSLFGASTVASVRFTTANDFEARDPGSYEIYGTNDAITSLDNSFGDQENWTLIASDVLSLPAERGTQSAIFDFTPSASYTSYRVLFPTLKDSPNANSMQIAEVELFSGAGGTGSNVLNFADPVLAIDTDSEPDSNYPANEAPRFLLDGTGPSPISPMTSNYPAAEAPPMLIDNDVNTKYLNFGDLDSGFIVTPSSGPSAVGSFTLTTANDAPQRDPSMYELWGTNDAITSADNSLGLDENWTMISSGTLTLPADRLTLGAVVPTGSSTAYSSFKMVFPDVKGDGMGGDKGIMQLAEASFYASTDGTGSDLLQPGDSILAIDESMLSGTETKYLNGGGINSGFIVKPSVGNTIVNEFQLITANDFPERDPKSWALYGTNDAITSADNSQGDEENWVLIDSGTFDDTQVPMERQTTGAAVPVSNTTEYAAYRMVITDLRDPLDPDAGATQFAGIQFFGDITSAPLTGDYDNDGLVGQGDLDLVLLNWGDTAPPVPSGWVNQQPNGLIGQAELDGVLLNWGNTAVAAASAAVPEPSTAVIALLAALGLSAGAHRRNIRIA